METLKKCFKCKFEKPLTEFYRHKKMVDGHLGKCKECTRKESATRYNNLKEDPEWITKERKRVRERDRKPYFRDKKKERLKPIKKESNKAYNSKYPEKRTARILSKSIQVAEGLHKHHWSYNLKDAKDVIFLTVKDHSKAHRFIIYDQEYFMYRRFDTEELLDTKQKHEEFIRECIKKFED